MDYHSMKRSELQALCKKHKIPANSANSVLADKLSELLNVKQEKQKPKARQRTCIKSSVETVDESESAVSRRQSKKVRFSPEVDYERSAKKQQAMEPVVTEVKGRRKSVARKADKPAVDNDNTVTDDAVQIPIKLTRSKVQILEKDDVVQTNEKKRGRKAVKDVEKETEPVKEPEANVGKVTRSKANTVGKGNVQTDGNKQSKRAVKDDEKESEPVKETVAGRARVTRSKAQTLTEDIKEPDLSPEFKKKIGRRTVKDEVKAEPSKEVKDEVKFEVKDVPVRATRSRGQTLIDDNVVEKPQTEKKRTRKDDTVVANPPVEKKRTRRDTIVPDVSHDIKNEDEGEKLGRGRRKKTIDEKTPEVLEIQDNADKGTRQTRRNKGKVEDDSTVLNQEASKVEVVNEKKVARSKASLAKTSPKGKGKSKVEVQQLEEPLKPEGKRNTRRKSVMQSISLEVVLPLEEPVNVPVKKETRRKSVAPKAQGKGSKKPVVEKKETVKETKIPESPNVKTSGKKQSKDASENETKEVASGSESQKSRKRKGEPVIEDETVKIEPVSTRKSSVKKQESVVKTPASRTGEKRAKLSGIKQSGSGDKGEKSDTVGTPVSKMANLETDKKGKETEKTPAIDASGRRFTRGANRKEPSQSAIKEQEVGNSQLSSRKPKKFMNTAPGRFTRGAVKVQETESTHESQPLDDAEVNPSQDVTIEVPFEVSKEDENQILEPSGDVAASEAIEEVIIPISEAPIVEEDVSFVPKEDASGVKSDKICDGSGGGNDKIPDETSSETYLSDIKTTPSSIKQSGSGDKGEKSDTVGTPVSKMANLETDEKVKETEKTPAIDASGRRFTRGANRKEPSQSAIKEQEVGNSQLSSRKPKKFMNTAPGRFTRGAVKVQETESTHESQPLDDAEVKPSQDVTIEVPSEVSKEDENQILEPSGDVAASEAIEEVIIPISEAPIVEEDASPVVKQDASGVESDEICDGLGVGNDEKIPDETPSETDVSDVKITPSLVAEVAETTIDAPSTVAEVAETTIDAPSSGLRVQNQNQEVSETEVQVAVNLAKQILQSAFPEILGQETELTNSGSTSEGLQADVAVEEPVVSAVKTDVTEESADISLQQSDIKGKSKEIEEPSVVEGVSQIIADDEANAPIDGDEDVKEDEKVTVPENSITQSELEKVDAEEVPEKDVESDVVLSTGTDVNEISVEAKSDDEDEGVDNIKEPESDTNVKGGETEKEQLTSHYGTAMEDQDAGDDELEHVQNENVPVVTEVLNNSSDQEQEQETSRSEDVPKLPEVSIESPDQEPQSEVRNELRTEGDELATESERALVDEKPNVEERSPFENLNEEPAVDGLATDQLPGDLGADGSPSTEEAPVDDTDADPPTPFKDEDRDNLGDLGNYNFGTDDFQKPVSANESEDVDGQSTKDDQASGHQTSSPAVANTSEEFFDWTDSNLKALLKTPGTTQASNVKDPQQSTVGFALPHEDDTTQNPDSSLKALFRTPATTEVSQNPDSSLKALFRTPATTQVSQNPDSSLKALFRTPATTQVSQNPDSSLKALFRTPATTQVSHKIDREQSTVRSTYPDEQVNETQNPGSSIKALFATPAPTREDREQSTIRSALPVEDDTKDKAPQDPDLSLKGSLKTPATTRVSHMKEREQSTVKITLSEEDDTPATAQISHVKEHQQSRVRFALPDEDDTKGNTTQNQGSSLRGLFATPATGRVSHVNNSQQSTGRTALPDDIFDQDEKLGDATQNQGVGEEPKSSETFGVINFENLSRIFGDDDYSGTQDNTTQNPGLIEDPKSQSFEDFDKYFDNDQVDDDGSRDNLGKGTGFDFKYGDQMDQEAAGTSHTDAFSALKDDSVRSGQVEKNDESQFSNK